ncbi:hypothetical protein [Erythrobacter sp. CCH5-A1]|uniref:hypothetical protein n=1 Tax=Erythrobacter sp. CCH5-A1 TaxID=1768792 RepID=UPI000832979E|nr:hypothetical protein [Erythrobacter sp. CCH5-A1]
MKPRPSLFIRDLEGGVIEASRRYLDRVETREQLAAIDGQLRDMMGEGCIVDDDVGNWMAFWAQRDLPVRQRGKS